MQTYHNKTVQQTAELLGTDIKTGLTHDEVKKRLHHYGKNELIEKKKKNIFIKFLEQFNDFMIKNNGKSWLSEVEKRNQTIAHSFLFCAKMKEFV